MKKVALFLIVTMLIGAFLYLFPEPIQAQEIGYYTYDVKTGAWIWRPGPWKPTYYERKTMRSITICVKGLPSDISTNVYVDGKLVGSIQGSGCKTFIVSKREGHIFCIDEEVRGISYIYEGITVSTRYICPGKCWNIEPIEKKQVCEYVPVCTWVCRYCPDYALCPACCPCEYVCYMDYRCHYEEEEVGPQSYTFEYYTQHQLAVVNPHGDYINEWIKDGTMINIFAKEVISLKDESRIKERDLFQYWRINGQLNENNAVTLLINKPYVAKAFYEKEIEYRIKVDSEYGNPTMDKTGGWYKRGEEATISVESQVPLEGWKGAWGGVRVFAGWFSEEGLESRSPTYTFTVESAKNFHAEWKIDDSKPIMYLWILIIVVIGAVAAIAVFILYRTGRMFQRIPKKPEPQV
jgi:hypothetical protein